MPLEACRCPGGLLHPHSATLQGYLRFAGRRSALQSVEQDDVDRLYASIGTHPGHQPLPKNLHRPTLELVLKVLRAHSETVSALYVAEGTGLSRATARRYLEYLD